MEESGIVMKKDEIIEKVIVLLYDVNEEFKSLSKDDPRKGGTMKERAILMNILGKFVGINM